MLFLPEFSEMGQDQATLYPFDNIPETPEGVTEILQRHSPKQMKKAARFMIDELSIYVVEDVPEDLKKHGMFLIRDEGTSPREWGLAFKYRNDQPWFLVIRGGKHHCPTFGGHDVVHLHHTRDLQNWRNVVQFLSECLWALIHRSDAPDKKPLLDVLDVMRNYLKSDLLEHLATALMTVNFFQTVEQEQDSSYTLEISRTIEDWTTAQQMMESFYPSCLKKFQDIWERLKRDDRTVVLLARSRMQPDDTAERPTVLGFLVGGVHPTSNVPHIISMVVLPDERRRGIGRSLVRRFFAHTGYSEVLANVVFKPDQTPCEVGIFLKSMGGVMFGTKGATFWRFKIPNPFSQKQKKS